MYLYICYHYWVIVGDDGDVGALAYPDFGPPLTHIKTAAAVPTEKPTIPRATPADAPGVKLT